MEDYEEEWEDFEEQWEELEEEWEQLEDIPEVYPEEELLTEIEVPDVWWAEDIKNIDDPEIREEEIRTAEEILEKEEAVTRQLESGEITDEEHWNKCLFELLDEERRAATRCGLESVGLSYDHLGDLSEDREFYEVQASGGPDLLGQKERIRQAIDDLGPEAAQELADRLRDEGELGETAHALVSRQVRLNGK